MNRTALITWLILIPAALCAHGAANADSIFNTGKSRSMFADRRAHGVGDVVTVLITESTVASQQANTEVQKSLDAQAGGGKGVFGLLNIIPHASLSGDT